MVTLKNDKLTVELSEYKAQIVSIKTNDGTEYMWQGGEGFWEGVAPNLFPIVGRLRDNYYTLDGKEYSMHFHGFAYLSTFNVVENDDTHVVFEIVDDQKTYESYPFHFSFKIAYDLADDVVSVKYIVENRDDKTMYYSVGGHPAFRVPLSKGGYFDQYYLEFDKECTPIGYGLTDDGFITGEKAPFSLIADKILPLAGQEIFVPTVFLENMDTTVTLKSNKTRRSVKVSYEGFRFLALWHDNNGPFMCIEPWTGTPDLLGNSRELKDKYAITAIESKAINEHVFTITIK